MRRLVLLALAAGLVPAASLTSAHAAEPERTAWYTALAVGPVTAPAPTVGEGDLQVAGTGARPTAYAALALAAPPGAGGELVLAVRSMTGTPEVAACPTKEADWEDGGGQPFSAGPDYDCAAGSVFGSLSADGTSISFPVDTSLRTGDGAYSIALAPLPESTAPFSIVLGDPAFTPEPAAAEAEPAPAAPDTAPAPEAPAVPGPGPLEAPAPAPLEEAPVEAPGLADAPPLLAVDEPPLPADAAPAAAPPAVAPPGAAPATVLPGAQLAAARPEDGTATGPRLLALLALVGVSAGAGYAAGQQRPAPRLLGGRARALPAGGSTGATGTAVAVAMPAPALQPRGIGRFSRARVNPPRRLR